MKTLNKTSYDYLKKMITDNDSIKFILSYVEGLGIDYSKYSSPVHYLNSKLTITYRRNTEYHYI